MPVLLMASIVFSDADFSIMALIFGNVALNQGTLPASGVVRFLPANPLSTLVAPKKAEEKAE